MVGFKCFLCPSGVDEFPNVEREDLEKAFSALEGTGSLLAVSRYIPILIEKLEASLPRISMVKFVSYIVCIVG